MTNLVACLGTGTGTWTGVLQLAARSEFTNTFLIVNEWTKNNLKINMPNIHVIVVNTEDKTMALRDQIAAQLKGKIKDLEVAVNIESGSGKEHMALLTGLMRIGLSFRFVALENDKVEEITYDLQIPKEELY